MSAFGLTPAYAPPAAPPVTNTVTQPSKSRVPRGSTVTVAAPSSVAHIPQPGFTYDAETPTVFFGTLLWGEGMLAYFFAGVLILVALILAVIVYYYLTAQTGVFLGWILYQILTMIIGIALLSFYALEWLALREKYNKMRINNRPVHFFGSWKLFNGIWLGNTILSFCTFFLWGMLGFRAKMLGEYLDEHLCYKDELNERGKPVRERSEFWVERARAGLLYEVLYWYVNPCTLYLFDWYFHPMYWTRYFENASFGGQKMEYRPPQEYAKRWCGIGACLNRWVFFLPFGLYDPRFGMASVARFHDSFIHYVGVSRVEETPFQPPSTKDDDPLDQEAAANGSNIYFFRADIGVRWRLVYFLVNIFIWLIGYIIEYFTVGIAIIFFSISYGVFRYIKLRIKYRRMKVRGRDVVFFGSWTTMIMLWFADRVMAWATLRLWRLMARGASDIYIDEHLCFRDEIRVGARKPLVGDVEPWTLEGADMPYVWWLLYTYGRYTLFFNWIIEPKYHQYMFDDAVLGGYKFKYVGTPQAYKPFFWKNLLRGYWFCGNMFTEWHDEQLKFAGTVDEPIEVEVPNPVFMDGNRPNTPRNYHPQPDRMNVRRTSTNNIQSLYFSGNVVEAGVPLENSP